MKKAIVYTILLTSMPGCIKVPPTDDFVPCSLAERIGHRTEWRRGLPQSPVALEYISCALANELSSEAAIQIALLNNPKIQALFEEIGISQADILEAGLLTNPSFELEVRFPQRRDLFTNIEYLILTSLLDVFLIPLRTKLAKTEYEKTKRLVCDQILEVAFQVRQTFYELLIEIKKKQYLVQAVQIAGIHQKLSLKQIDVGTVNVLDVQNSQARYIESSLALAQIDSEIIRLSAELNRLLGLREDVCLILQDFLPQLDGCCLNLCELEAIALQYRLDLQAARFELCRISQLLGLKAWWTFTNLEGGLAGERDPDGTNLIGPGFSAEIPLFNYGQAARMRLFSELRQARDYLTELEIRIQSEVREAYKLLANSLLIMKDYEAGLLPIFSNIAASSEAFYNVMGLGINKLLESKRMELMIQQSYLENYKKAIIAAVQLDHALGGNLFRLIGKEICVQEQVK